MEESSITAIKADFIRSQVRHLSAPLEPFPYHQPLSLDESDNSRLSEKATRDIVQKVNERIRQHNRRVYSAQSQRHVSEQIESLHWNQVGNDEERSELDTVAIRRDAPLTQSETVASLPENYIDLHLHPDHRLDDEQAKQYQNSRQRLLTLTQQRDEMRQKVQQYRHLVTMLEPFNDPQANIQPNLVTRDGQLSIELDRMRVLLARVTSRVAELADAPRKPGAHETTVRSIPSQQKIANLMQPT
ncbi:hypothetical protein B0A52_00094 [Exophiala mesophila]|uniref:Kinetochore protein fta4 n=1 Tax=Exophiala mesophila TaxID=212818 RepID=A0A438NJ29_EXOME|nr:hypothetical protein B0A52_00094 [Exophiala mesophila]